MNQRNSPGAEPPGSTTRAGDGRAALDSVAVGAAAVAALLALGVWAAGVEMYHDELLATERSEEAAHARLAAADLRELVADRTAVCSDLDSFTESRLASGPLDSVSLDTYAAGLFSGIRGMRAVQLARGGVISWVYPLSRNEAALGLDIVRHPNAEVRTDVARALAGDGTSVSDPFELAQGGLGLAIRRRVVVSGETWGVAAVVLDVEPLLSSAGLSATTPHHAWAVVDSAGHRFAGSAAVLASSPATAAVAVDGRRWTVATVPSRGWGAAHVLDMKVVGALGLAFISMLSLIVYLVVSRERRLARVVEERTGELFASERRARALFERSPVSLWSEDFSEVRRRLEALKSEGVDDVRAFLETHDDVLGELIASIRILDVNQATLPLYGVGTKRELLSGLLGFSTPTSRDIFIAQMVAVAEGRSEFWGDSALRARDGELRHVGVRWSVMPGHEIDYEAVVVSIVDLTDRVRAQHELDAIRQNLEGIVERRTAELVRANRELKAAQKAKDAFLANMSHELRTPLNSVLGFTGVMLQGAAGPLTDEQVRQLEMVRRSGRQLLKLVNDMLDLARIESGKVGLEITRTDACAAARAAAESIRPMANEKSLDVQLVVPDGEVLVETDEDRLGQMLLNLLANAVKFTPAGHVGVQVAADDERVLFTVSDTGPGISPRTSARRSSSRSTSSRPARKPRPPAAGSASRSRSISPTCSAVRSRRERRPRAVRASRCRFPARGRRRSPETVPTGVRPGRPGLLDAPRGLRLWYRSISPVGARSSVG